MNRDICTGVSFFAQVCWRAQDEPEDFGKNGRETLQAPFFGGRFAHPLPRVLRRRFFVCLFRPPLLWQDIWISGRQWEQRATNRD